eukprot:10131392-Alexandrium_andersonii.AAC.1
MDTDSMPPPAAVPVRSAPAVPLVPAGSTISEAGQDEIARQAQAAMTYVANSELGPAGFVEASAALLEQVRGEFSAPLPTHGPDTSDDEVSRLSFTPIASRITSGDEAGGQLGSDVTSLDP